MRPLAAGVPLQFDPHGGFIQHVASAHAAASAALLQLLVRDRQLLIWLRSLKHFFLLDQASGVQG